MTALVLNLVLGFLPVLILGGSIAAGIEDDRRHRTMFLLVYGLWSLTLAMWNWMRSASVGWIVMWAVVGVASLVACAVMRKKRAA
jgi:hypothetical protein